MHCFWCVQGAGVAGIEGVFVVAEVIFVLCAALLADEEYDADDESYAALMDVSGEKTRGK